MVQRRPLVPVGGILLVAVLAVVGMAAPAAMLTRSVPIEVVAAGP